MTTPTRRSGAFTCGRPPSGPRAACAGPAGAGRAHRPAGAVAGPAGRVGDAQQQRDQQPVRHQRRTTGGQERRGLAGQRDQPADPADDDEDLQAEGEGEAAGEQLAERVPHGDRGPQAALDDQQVDHQQRGQPEEADLLADAGEDEVVVHLGHTYAARRRQAVARPGAEQAAGAEPEQRLHELVAVCRRRRRTGRSQMSTRWRSWRTGRRSMPPSDHARNAPPKKSSRPMISQLTRSVAM